jgi:hypothetical protein
MTNNSMYSQMPSISGGHLLQPQPEETPSCGDRDPHNKVTFHNLHHMYIIICAYLLADTQRLKMKIKYFAKSETPSEEMA